MLQEVERTQLIQMLSEYSSLKNNLDYIVKTYSEPHRKYHTLEHIKLMLDLRDKTFQSCSKSSVAANISNNLIYAIVYHDINYSATPQPPGMNEFNSATVNVCQCGYKLEVVEAIVATSFHNTDQKFLCPLAMELCDLDLANLALEYDQFEYWSSLAVEEAIAIYFNGKAPGSIIYHGQASFCHSMLEREKIYYVHPKWEDKARWNLEQKLIQLETRLKICMV